MKLGTIANGARNGMLAIVDRRGELATAVPGIAHTMQDALDDWGQLEQVSLRLRSGYQPGAKPVTEFNWVAPLPRAYQLLDGGGYRRRKYSLVGTAAETFQILWSGIAAAPSRPQAVTKSRSKVKKS